LASEQSEQDIIRSVPIRDLRYVHMYIYIYIYVHEA